MSEHETPATPASPLDLDEIEAGADAAGEGPFTILLSGNGVKVLDAGRRVVAYVEARPGVSPVPLASFFAHSREDVPALVSEVRRLRGYRDLYEAHAALVQATDEYRVACFRLDDGAKPRIVEQRRAWEAAKARAVAAREALGLET